MRSILFFLPLTVFAGQSLVLTPGITGTVVDPALPVSQSWRVEFQLTNWTVPPQGVWNASVFNLAGTGAAAFLYPDGRLALVDWLDTVSPNQPCFLSLAGQSNILVRFQRDVAQKRMVCESWNADGTGYQQNQGALASLATWGYSGGTIGSSYTSASLGFLHVSESVLADGSQPPTSWQSGDWTNLQFDGSLADSSGNNHNASMVGAVYVSTPALPPVALAKAYGAAAWSKFWTVRAGHPAQLDGTGSYSLESQALTYQWQQVDGPTTVRWSDTTSSTPVIEGLIFGTYTFRLRVTDGNGSTGSADVQVGGVATDDNGVVVYPDSKLDILLGPSRMFGANPWEWLDYRNQELFEVWANTYEINGGTVRLETDQKTINGIPRNGTVYASNNDNKIYGVGTNFLAVFCGGTAGPVVGNPYIVPLVPEGAANQTPKPYPREVASCQSDTELTMWSGWIWERPTVNAPGVGWGTWNICGDCGDWYGPGASPNVNYYDNALAHYALYYRSGWSKARDAARWMADRWYRSPWVLGMPNTPRNYALASTYLRAAVDGGNPDYDLWPSLREFTDQCFSPWGYSQNAPIVDVREASYCLAYTGLQGLLDPDPANKAVAQSRLVDAYGWIWGPQQHPNGNYVSNEIEGDFGRTFAVTQGSTTVTRVLGAAITSDYCGVPYASGGSIALNADRVTVTGAGTNFTGSGGKIMVLRGTLNGQPWSMTAQISTSPAPTMNSLTLVHPWRGDPGSVSATQWRIYNDSILGTSYFNMFFGQTNPDGSYPSPQVLDTDNWYWCTVVDGNTLTLDKPYTGDTSGGNVYRRPTWQNLTGRGSQPFMHGITAWAENYAAEALKGYNDTVADQYRTSMNKTVDWIWNYGRSPVTNGLMYGVEFSNCLNLTILPAHDCAQDQSASSNERAYNVETNAGFARKYLNTRSQDDLTRGDQWYTFQFARQGYASPLPGDGFYAEVIDPCCWMYSHQKGYGQVFGVGQAHQWPAARLGGVSPPNPQTVTVSLDLSQAASARVTVTQPSSATTQYTCTSSPCSVQVDARQGDHWAQIDYLSSTGQVVSSAAPILLSATGVTISGTTALVTPATATSVTASPSFNPAGGSYTSAQSVTITTTTTGALIRYTTDGSTPSSTAGTLYSGPVSVSSSLTLKAIAYASGMTDSPVTTAAFTIGVSVTGGVSATGGGVSNTAAFVKTDTATQGTWKGVYGANGYNAIDDTASYPAYVTVTPAGQSNYIWAASTSDVRGLQKVLSSTDRLAATWYSPGTYTIDLNFNDGVQHQLAVYCVDWDTGGLRTQTLSILDGATNSVLNSQNISSFQNGVYVVWNVSGHVILRVTNNSSINAVTGGLFFDSAATPSAVITPAFSPSGGIYSSAQSVTISTTTTGASIRYTTDGSTPSSTVGTVYAGPVAVGSSMTLKAIAYMSGMTDSTVSSAAYTIQVAAPTFALPAGSYGSAQSVIISSTTAGASIRYTTDGSTPSSTVGTVYGGPVTVGSSMTLKAIAYMSGLADSTVSSAAYTIAVTTTGGGTPSGGGTTVIGATVWPNGYAYRGAITVAHGQVPNTDQLNFPVSVSGTYPDLATTANGGKVANASGYDITFTSDANGQNKLNFQRVSYTASTGQVSFWVQIPTLSHTTDTVFYVFYGNSAITTDRANSAGVWDSNYKAVWHFPDPTTLILTDSTSNGNDATNHGATAAVGQMDGAAAFTGSNQYVSLSTPNVPTGSSPRTMEVWFKMSANQAQSIAGYGKNGKNSATGSRFNFYYDGSNRLYLEAQGISANFKWVFDTGWHHLVATLPSGTTTSNILMYLDGAAQALSSDGGTLNTSNAELALGKLPGATALLLSGTLDEFRISSVARSADWIQAEYNNQCNCSAFYGAQWGQTNAGTPATP